LEGFRFTLQLAQAALKSSILINGGGAIARLAFMGHLFDVSDLAMAEYLSSSLIVFAIGNLVGAIASGATYLRKFYRTISELTELMADCLPKSQIFNV